MSRRLWKLCALAAITVLTASAATAQAPAPVRPAYGPPLSLADAKTMAAAAEAAAKKIDALMVVVVVEPTGDVVLLEKMDGTQYSSVDIATQKARSAARFRRPTKEFEDGVATRPALLAMPGVLPIAGGVLVLKGGKLVGAVGVSGGTTAQDEQVAAAAIAAFH